MDKAEFLRLAPYYYALGIIHYLLRDPSAATERQMQDYYADIEYDERTSYFAHERIFDRGVEFLKKAGIIEVISDPFAPIIIRQTPQFHAYLRGLFEDPEYPFFKYEMAGDEDRWVREALRSLDQESTRQDLQPGDFDVPPEQEWKPLPLDRNDPDLQSTIEKIDETVEQVRGDNGYAANLPEERTYVLETLSTLSKKLKEAATISVPYIRGYALEPLSMLVRRFGKTALGILASAAKEAFKEWLKKRGITLLDDFKHRMPNEKKYCLVKNIVRMTHENNLI